MGEQVALGIDMGGSKLAVGLVSRRGQVLAQRRRPWWERTPQGVLAAVLAEARALLAEHPAIQPAVIGANIPGLTDRHNGVWVEASFSGIRDWPVARALEEALALPCFIDNDCRASALAESWYGAAQGVRDFLYLTVSNGIGGAVFLHGVPYEGAHGGAGELGHVLVVPGGRLCGCGNRGCLEQHAAGPGIARNYRELAGISEDAPLIEAKEIAMRARRGEGPALDVFGMEGVYLGEALAAAANLLNPALVVLGGGVSLSFGLFGETLQKTMEAHMYRAANPGLQVLPTALGYEGALLGAAAVAFRG